MSECINILTSECMKVLMDEWMNGCQLMPSSKASHKGVSVGPGGIELLPLACSSSLYPSYVYTYRLIIVIF